MLIRDRVFTVTALAALAAGIGANSAMFSLIYGVLLKPLPFRDPERIVRVYANNPAERLQSFPLSPADFLDFRSRNRVFREMAAYIRQDQQYGGERPERLVGLRVSYGFFRIFGVEPRLGRTFTSEEESAGGPAAVAIISDHLWRRLLGSDPHVIGREIRLSDDPFRIIGVMPPAFDEESEIFRIPQGEHVDVWLPLNTLRDRQRESRLFRYCRTLAALEPQISIEQADADMNTIAAGLAAEYPEDRNWHVQVRPLRDDMVAAARPTLLILAGAVGFVLLLACVNIANLLLARATAREREMAIRAAVGASRARLMRQLLTESLLLATCGGALGLLVGYAGVRLLVALAAEHVPRLGEAALDIPVVLATAGASLVSGVLFGMAPALSISIRGSHSRARGLLVAGEVALTLVLLIGAGLLLRSFLALGRVDPGFRSQNVLTMHTALSYGRLAGARRYAAFYERFVESLARLPGVTSAGAASDLPWSGSNNEALFGIERRPRPRNLSMRAHFQSVSPDYFRTIGLPLLAGRWLTTADHFDAPRVVLVNKALALQYWPALRDCIGQRIYTLSKENAIETVMTIVGVTGDIKDGPTDAAARPAFYLPFLQNPSFGNYVAVRTTAAPELVIPAIRETARQMGNDLSVEEIRSMESVLAGAVAAQRFALQVAGMLAALALLLALVGIYGVMAYIAGRRAKEIAIRSAIGARPWQTARLLLNQVGRWVALGLLAGSLAAAALSRALAHLLYQVSATDPLTFAAVVVILAAASLVASGLPVRRAVQADPMEILRHE